MHNIETASNLLEKPEPSFWDLNTVNELVESVELNLAEKEWPEEFRSIYEGVKPFRFEIKKWAKKFTLYNERSLKIANNFMVRLLLDEILESIENSLGFDATLLSGDNMNIMALLEALEIDINSSSPRPASTLLIEVHSKDDRDEEELEDHFVHVIYNEKVQKIPFCGNEQKCGLRVFARHLMKFIYVCLLYTSPSPRDKRQSRMPSSA